MNDEAPAILLRVADAADHEAVAALWHASASLPGVGPAQMPGKDELQARLEAGIAAGWHIVLALGEAEILGFAALRLEEGVLAELFVRPDAVGMGIGRTLLDSAKIAMPAGFRLFTRSSNLGACRFYEREGLRALGEGTHMRTGEPVIHFGWGGG